MEAKVLSEEKNYTIVELDNQTIAEILRVQLNKDSAVESAVWKRAHPEKPITLEVKTSGKSAKKAVEDAAADIEKQLDKIVDEFKKTVK